MHQASLAGNILVVLPTFLKRKRGMGNEKRKSVSAAVENKAIFRRYVEEMANQGNLKVADEIFDRYISHQPDGSTLERDPEDVKRFHRGGAQLSPTFTSASRSRSQKGTRW
jgi:hypothetical protein